MTSKPGRKYMRVPPDPTEYVQIDLSVDGEFKFSYAALVVEESPMGGCSIVCLESVGLDVGTKCRMKVGSISPLLSEIVWATKLDDHIIRYGVKFLE